jgi:hypothetical protein
MTQEHGNESLEKFEYSEAALDQYYASRRRNVRPSLVFLIMMFSGLALQKFGAPMLVLLVLWSVGMIAVFVVVAQNFRIQRRADMRFKAEKREWEVKQARPS